MATNKLTNKRIEEIKNEILGKAYELSFVFVSRAKIKELNKKYRGKDEPTDILSFPLESNGGEILICKEAAKEKFEEVWKGKYRTFENYLIFLVIHGCLHLKGLEHGSKMEKYELSHYSRYRRRHL